MKNPIVSSVGLAALLAVLAVGIVQSGPRPAPASPILADWTPEVRIRKLHLVRPDLIPYPIYFEVVC